MSYSPYNQISSSFILNLIHSINSSSISLNKIILKARIYCGGFTYLSSISFIEIEKLFFKENCSWNIKKGRALIDNDPDYPCDCLIIFRVL